MVFEVLQSAGTTTGQGTVEWPASCFSVHTSRRKKFGEDFWTKIKMKNGEIFFMMITPVISKNKTKKNLKQE